MGIRQMTEPLNHYSVPTVYLKTAGLPAPADAQTAQQTERVAPMSHNHHKDHPADLTFRTAQHPDVLPALRMRNLANRKVKVYAGLGDERFFTRLAERLDQDVAWSQRGLAAEADLVIAETGPKDFSETSGIIAVAGATPVLPEDAETGVGIQMGML